MVLPLPMRMGSLEEFIDVDPGPHPPRRRQARADRRPAGRVLRGRRRATRRSSRCGAVLPGAPGVPSGDAPRAAGARPRAAGDPAVHERVDERAEGRDDPRPGAHRRTSTPAARRPSSTRRRGDGVVAAAVPRHGPRRLPGHPDDDAARTLVQAAPQDFLAQPGNWMQWISDCRGTATAGPNFAWVLATRALKRHARPRPVVAHARPDRRRAGRPRRGRGVRRRRRAVRLPGRRRVPGVRHGRGRHRRRRSRRAAGAWCATPSTASCSSATASPSRSTSTTPTTSQLARPPPAAARHAGARPGDAGRRPRDARGAARAPRRRAADPRHVGDAGLLQAPRRHGGAVPTTAGCAPATSPTCSTASWCCAGGSRT